MKRLLTGVVLAIGIAVPAVTAAQGVISAAAAGVATDGTGAEYRIAIGAIGGGLGHARITSPTGVVLSGPVIDVIEFLCPAPVVVVCDDKYDSCFDFENSTAISFDEANQTLSMSQYPDLLVAHPFLVLTMTKGLITTKGCP